MLDLCFRVLGKNFVLLLFSGMIEIEALNYSSCSHLTNLPFKCHSSLHGNLNDVEQTNKLESYSSKLGM